MCQSILLITTNQNYYAFHKGRYVPGCLLLATTLVAGLRSYKEAEGEKGWLNKKKSPSVNVSYDKLGLLRIEFVSILNSNVKARNKLVDDQSAL